jgi:hypothetical protein
VPVEPEELHQLLVQVWFTLLVVVVPVARAEQVEVLSVVMVQAALASMAYLAQQTLEAVVEETLHSATTQHLVETEALEL